MSAITSPVTSPIMEQQQQQQQQQVSSPHLSDNVPANTPLLDDYVKSKNNLPAKYAKFLQFGYFLLTNINSNSDTPLFDDHLIHHSLHLFNTTQNQIAFLNDFLNSSKSINKTIRKTISLHKKNIASNLGKPTVSPKPPSLPKKEKKKASIPSEEMSVTKNKKIRATDAVKEHIQSNNLKLETKDNKEKELKEKKVKDVKEKEVKEKKVKEVKEKEVKEKKVKEMKEKKVKEIKDKKEEKNEEKEVSVFVYDDKQYLIDEDNSVYDFETHDIIGSFVNGVITFN